VLQYSNAGLCGHGGAISVITKLHVIDIPPNSRQLPHVLIQYRVLRLSLARWSRSISGNHLLSKFPGSRRSRTRLIYPRTPTSRKTLHVLPNGAHLKIHIAPFSRHINPRLANPSLTQRCPDGSLALAHCENRSLQYLDLWVLPPPPTLPD